MPPLWVSIGYKPFENFGAPNSDNIWVTYLDGKHELHLRRTWLLHDIEPPLAIKTPVSKYKKQPWELLLGASVTWSYQRQLLRQFNNLQKGRSKSFHFNLHSSYQKKDHITAKALNFWSNSISKEERSRSNTSRNLITEIPSSSCPLEQLQISNIRSYWFSVPKLEPPVASRMVTVLK